MIEPRDVSTAPSREESDLAVPLQSEGEPEKAAGNGNPAKDTPSPHDAAIPNPEVSALPKRRRFSADYKARVVEEAEGCAEPGAIGALLRREGLYSSQLSSWRALYLTGALQALRDDKRGRKTKKHPLEDENEKLRKQNERLADRLERAETIIEIQKKVATMLGIPLNSVEGEETK
jgi:transposase-like protein